MGATMALIMLSILPVIIFYLCCQKHIIKGERGRRGREGLKNKAFSDK